MIFLQTEQGLPTHSSDIPIHRQCVVKPLRNVRYYFINLLFAPEGMRMEVQCYMFRDGFASKKRVHVEVQRIRFSHWLEIF